MKTVSTLILDLRQTNKAIGVMYCLTVMQDLTVIKDGALSTVSREVDKSIARISIMLQQECSHTPLAMTTCATSRAKLRLIIPTNM
jgi:hypothetical protein